MKDRKKLQLYTGITWKPLFVGLMTGILAKSSQLDPLLIGVALGIAASIGCFLELRKYLSETI